MVRTTTTLLSPRKEMEHITNHIHVGWSYRQSKTLLGRFNWKSDFSQIEMGDGIFRNIS